MNENPEQDLMLKIATILHEDRVAALPQSVFLSDGLGAHIEPEPVKQAEAHMPEPVSEPKSALAGMSVMQIMHRPEFQAGVQDALGQYMPEIAAAIEKQAALVGPKLRAAQASLKRGGFFAASKNTLLKAEKMNAKGIRGAIRRNPLKATAAAAGAGIAGTAAFKSGRDNPNG